MRRHRFLVLLVGGLLLAQTRPAVNREDLLGQYRNRGKAFYENPTTQVQAVEEFRKALALEQGSMRDRLNYGLALLRAGRTAEAIAELEKVRAQAPQLPHPWFNLGIAHKRAGETERALAMFEKLAQLAPDDAVTHYNLGVLYKLENKLDQALARFQKASALNPSLAAPHFQLYNAFRLAGKREEAAKELALFQERKKAQETSGSSEDMEWNDFAEIYDPVDASLSGQDAADVVPLRFTEKRIGSAVSGAAEALVLNFDGDAKPDVLVWSAAEGGRLYRGGLTAAGEWKDGRSFAAADVDNDGLPELCMLTAGTAELLWNRKGRYEKAAQPLARGEFTRAVWVDYDHDYDLDLLLLGPKKSVLLRNQGTSGFADRSADFPFVAGEAVDGVVLRVVPDSKSHDVLVTYRNRAGVLYRDRLAGFYEAQTLEAVAAGASAVQAWDWNHDSMPDLAFVVGGKLRLLANVRGVWKAQAGPDVTGGVFCDFANLATTEICWGGMVYPLNGTPRKGVEALAVADFNGDGRMDAIRADGIGTFLEENATVLRNRWLSVRLNGVKNLKMAAGAEVEVRTGRRYQKRTYGGYALTFGLRGYDQVDTVRITWPNGLIQNEARQMVNRAFEYKEAQRLSGSCPMIFTWDGQQFRFVTDVLGVAPLGASAGDGKYFPTDHDEYVSIDGEWLREREGYYDVRVTEELAEVTYLDKVRLIAVDHPTGTEVYSNDKWKSPPYPEFRLYSTGRRIYPVSARDDQGSDVLAEVKARDQRFAGPRERTMLNTASPHSLELDFGPVAPGDGAFLVLNGWVDWADGSTFLKQSQERGKELVPPYLQVKDSAGKWVTVIEDMGIPSGKTKTIAVDLSGKFLSASRAVRIVTNFCVYWDEVFLGVEREKAQVKLREMEAAVAELGFHGFSQPRIDPDRRRPEWFLYEPAGEASSWNPTPGLYTRYGDVRALVGEADDRFVIMGSGDEVRLRFRSPGAVAAGWKRDFLLYVDGWAKDSDANTAYSQSVEPLPFHRMSQYPYPDGERYPDTPGHRAYREQYNTRPALRLLRSLAP